MLAPASSLGAITTPDQGNRLPPGVRWCADNGCFGAAWREDSWLAFLDRLADRAADCLFAVAPDAICDHQRTYRRADRYLEAIRGRGYPVAFVAQNGARPDRLDWHRFDALFIGGDTEWKLGGEARELVDTAKSRGQWVHMGRVNSGRRLRYASLIGCDSADGTYLTRGPDVNLPRVARWLAAVNGQLVLGGAA